MRVVAEFLEGPVKQNRGHPLSLKDFLFDLFLSFGFDPRISKFVGYGVEVVG